jgi:hypothetical protein
LIIFLESRELSKFIPITFLAVDLISPKLDIPPSNVGYLPVVSALYTIPDENSPKVISPLFLTLPAKSFPSLSSIKYIAADFSPTEILPLFSISALLP